jgi:ABC-2 type transport system ATP-binding protein
LMLPTSGRVRVFGGDPTNPENRTRTGAMLQVGRVPETLRVREHIDLFSAYYQKPMARADVLAAAGLEKLSERKFGELSGGQKQRVLFALAISGDPDMLFLDEPTVGLDVEARRMLWDEIRQLVNRGKTVLLTMHYLQEADALADRVAVINQGKIIAEGTPAEIKAQTAGKRIRCITSLGINALRQIPGVTEVKPDREAVELHTAAAEPVVRELLARDANFSGLEVASAGVEEAFLALTQDTSRNGNHSNETAGVARSDARGLRFAGPLAFAHDACFLLLDGLVRPGHTRSVVGDADVARGVQHDDAAMAVDALLQIVHRFLRGPLRQIPGGDSVDGPFG